MAKRKESIFVEGEELIVNQVVMENDAWFFVCETLDGEELDYKIHESYVEGIHKPRIGV